MAEELRQSLEKMRAAADIIHALAVQMAELLKLREAVREAEEAAARKRSKQRYREIISPAYRAQADAPGMEAQAKHRLASQRSNQVFSRSVAQASDLNSPEHEARIRNGTRKTRALPGRLFMQSQWR
jgi:orotidine-5'-phosphate decarboxylase